MTIKVSQNEPIESAVRRMTRYLENEALSETLMERKLYRKPQQKRYATEKVLTKAKKRRRQVKRAQGNKGKPRRV